MKGICLCSRPAGWSAKILIALGWWLSAVLVACAPVGPDYLPPRPELPATWSGVGGDNVAPAGIDELENWWSLFNDPLLNSLIKRGAAANPGVKIAEARILQARAQYRLTTAASAPTSEVSGSYANSRRSGNITGSGAGTTQDLFQAGFDAGWEIDIFGGARRAAEAAEARLAAARENRDDVLIILEAEVARNYLELRGSQQRLATARNNLAIQGKTLDLVRGRQESGLGSQLEVAEAETQLALTRAQLPPLEDSTGQASYRLALLLGLQPRALSEELAPTMSLPASPAGLPNTLPSDLLRRRPDIRWAERQLAAATADIGVATAELFPRFSLTGLVGLQSANLSDLLSAGSRYWTVGPTVRWSLFDGGRARANIELDRGRRDEARIVYEDTVLTALNEVESAMLALAREEESRQTLAEAVAASQRAVDLASGRYRSGLAGFLDVLQSEHNLYQSQDQLVQSEQRLALDWVALFKALGGGWNLGPAREEPANLPATPLTPNPTSTPSGEIH